MDFVYLSRLGVGTKFTVYKACLTRCSESGLREVAVKFSHEMKVDKFFTKTILEQEMEEHRKFYEASPKHVAQPLCVRKDPSKHFDRYLSMSAFAKGRTLFHILTNTVYPKHLLMDIVCRIYDELYRLNTVCKLYHCDCHFGNILVDTEAVPWNFTFIDFDMANDLGVEFFSKGKAKEYIDANHFLFNLYALRNDFKNQTFAKLMLKKIIRHVRMLQLRIQSVPVTEWVDETPVLYRKSPNKNSESRIFSHVDKDGKVCFFDSEDKADPHKCLVNLASTHSIYYFAHVPMPGLHPSHLRDCTIVAEP